MWFRESRQEFEKAEGYWGSERPQDMVLKRTKDVNLKGLKGRFLEVFKICGSKGLKWMKDGVSKGIEILF